MCGEYGPQSPKLLDTLGPKIGQIPVFGNFSKRFHWFRISHGLHVNCVVHWSQRPYFQVILGPKIDHNSGLQSFSQKLSTGFAAFLFYMPIVGTFQCISMLCPNGHISGHRVKVAAELVRPSGLLSFYWYIYQFSLVYSWFIVAHIFNNCRILVEKGNWFVVIFFIVEWWQWCKFAVKSILYDKCG